MDDLLSEYVIIAVYLKEKGINSILYGSLGASLYLGEFKKINDIDLLIEDQWLGKKWKIFIKLLETQGYKLKDEKDHEFENDKGVVLAFAEKSVLKKDNICNSNDVVNIDWKGNEIVTLSPQNFVKAYEFSLKDGYRLNNREKKDAETINLLKGYIENNG